MNITEIKKLSKKGKIIKLYYIDNMVVFHRVEN